MFFKRLSKNIEETERILYILIYMQSSFLLKNRKTLRLCIKKMYIKERLEKICLLLHYVI